MSNSTSSLVLLRKPDVLKKTGLCKSSIYEKINSGTFPPPISISLRSVAWPEHEIDAVIRAQIAGKSDAEIKEIIQKILISRQT